jgi:hypothetical protein
MPAKAGIHDFTIQSHACAAMTTSLRGRAAAEASQLSAKERKDGLLRRFVPRAGLLGLAALSSLFLLTSTDVSAAVETGTYQFEGMFLFVPVSVTEFGVAYFKGSISARAPITKLNFSFGSSENKKSQIIKCSGTYKGYEKMLTIPISCSDGLTGYATETHDPCDPVRGFDGGSIILERGIKGTFFLQGQSSCSHLVN